MCLHLKKQYYNTHILSFLKKQLEQPHGSLECILLFRIDQVVFMLCLVRQLARIKYARKDEIPNSAVPTDWVWGTLITPVFLLPNPDPEDWLFQ